MALCSFSFQYISTIILLLCNICGHDPDPFSLLYPNTLVPHIGKPDISRILLHSFSAFTPQHHISFLSFILLVLCYSLMLVSRILYYAPPSLLLKHNLLHVYFLLSISPSPRKRKTMGTTFSLCHPMPSFFPFTPTFSFTYSPCIPQQSGTYHFPPSTFVHQAYIPLYPLLLIRHEFNKFSSLTLTSCYSLSYLFIK